MAELIKAGLYDNIEYFLFKNCLKGPKNQDTQQIVNHSKII